MGDQRGLPCIRNEAGGVLMPDISHFNPLTNLFRFRL
jgi:hypothetical protein